MQPRIPSAARENRVVRGRYVDLLKDYLDRMLYYSTWPISEQKDVSTKNYLLDEVYVLSFCNFALVHDTDWDEGAEPRIVSSYSIREDGNGELMTNALHFKVRNNCLNFDIAKNFACET